MTHLSKTPQSLWERARSRWNQRGLPDGPSRLYREQAPSHRGPVALLAIAVSLAGCAGLPDQRLANEALKRGDTVTAQQNYQQLADLGYSEAQVGLADIQVGTRDPAQIKQAEATYRAAADTSPRAQARLGRLLVAKPGATEAEHREAEGLLKKAFAFVEKKKTKVTDEASAVELVANSVRLVESSVSNIKITTPDDLTLAAALMRLF